MPRSFLVALNLATGAVRASGQTWQVGPVLFASQGVMDGGNLGLERAYAAHGARLAASLEGQYSAIILESRTRDLTLVQDALGLGQVYWGKSADWVVAGSSPLGVAATLGMEALEEAYFAPLLGWGLPRKLTPFRGVHALDGGTALTITPQGDHLIRPWSPEPLPVRGDLDRQLEELIAEAIDLLVPSDQPSIFEVSGGTDSAVVSLQARRMGRDFTALTYVADRYVLGDDNGHSEVMVQHLGVPQHEIDGDVFRLCTKLHRLPDHPGSCRYLHAVDHIAELAKQGGTRCYVTGVGGDLIFDYSGLVPAFLADPLVRLRPVAALTQARRYAKERGGHRSATHYLRYVALPLARFYARGESLAQGLEPPKLPWLSKEFEAHSIALDKLSDVPRGMLPSAHYLWDAVFQMSRGERLTAGFGPDVTTVHPLLHRPLVAFMLSLDMETRRGLPGDRRLQRRYLARYGPAQIAQRRTKGSAEPLRQVHIGEAPEFLMDIRDHSRIEARGWVEPQAWRQAVDQAALGANPSFAFFASAIEVELWLRAFEDHGLPKDLALDLNASAASQATTGEFAPKLDP
ncbi:asparagine synthase-related protein [Tateyamaria pelophila]|uniref:asparagine synthase-related protein n=1 Tax=Tateyamaria pelophila TaxID=328415 RepID=UPI001CBB1C1A|nr:asparagine synthase C-terminal domain-containing protein [Tateyamaria pelophila]